MELGENYMTSPFNYGYHQQKRQLEEAKAKKRREVPTPMFSQATEAEIALVNSIKESVKRKEAPRG